MYMYFYILRIAEVLEQVLKISQNLNSEEEDMVVIVAALNFIKRKQIENTKTIRGKDLFGQNHGYSVGLILVYTTLLLRNSALKAKALTIFFLQMTKDNSLEISYCIRNDIKNHDTKFW